MRKRNYKIWAGRKNLDKTIKKAEKEQYAEAVKKVKIPPESFGRVERRKDVAEQLKKLGVKNEYVAYAIASRIIKK